MHAVHDRPSRARLHERSLVVNAWRFAARSASLSLLACAMSVGFGQMTAARAQSGSTAPVAAGTRTDTAKVPPPTNPVAMLAGQLGASKCADVARKIGEQSVGAFPSAGVVLAPPTGAEHAAFSASVETRDGIGMHFVSAFLAPNDRAGCDGGYDDIRYWPKVCDQLVIDELRGLNGIRPLGPEIGTVVVAANQHIYLMNAGTGCVTIRKEMMF